MRSTNVLIALVIGCLGPACSDAAPTSQADCDAMDSEDEPLYYYELSHGGECFTQDDIEEAIDETLENP